jgi:hypothetical protein
LKQTVAEARDRVNELYRTDWFVNQVRGKGPWDYKQFAKTKRQKKAYGRFGNYHYGRVGAALGLSDWVLHGGAGLAQYLSGNWSPEFGIPVLQGVTTRRIKRGLTEE